ncbi:MAG: zinc ribbon domain-containing protein [Bacteroidales bacterium]|nr:zinc ribbon domain-containing protein [Bacteroidales bacterium]
MTHEKGGGTNADGSKSEKYCSYCYQDGKFFRPDFTAKQMQKLVKGKMKEKGIPGFLTPFFAYGIPRLERWKR